PIDYTQFVDQNGLRGARIGLTRVGLNGFDPFVPTPQPVTDAIEAAFAKLTDAGAIVIDLDAAGFTFASADGEFLVLLFEFRNDLAAYLSTRVGVPVAGGTLQTAIDFNNANEDREMPFFNQDIFDLAAALEPGPDDPQPIFGGLTYNQALAIDHNAGVNGIDAAIKLASGYEAFTQVRAHNLPPFAATAPSTNIGGTTLTRARRATPSSAPARVLRKPRNL